MSASVPCPVCGTANEPGATACEVCQYAFGSGVIPESKSKCPRCGSEVVDGYAFCQVCGLDLRSRLPRPGTRNLSIRGLRGQKPAPGPHGFRSGPSAAAPLQAPGQAAAEGGYQPSAAPAAPASPPQHHAQVQAAGAGRLQLVVVRRDGSEGEAYPLEGATTEVGRDRGAIRFPNDPFISPVHVRLTQRSDGSIDVVDLESRNGVFVRLGAVETVYPGDMFLLGHHLLRLDNAPASSEPSAGSDGVRGFGTPLESAWGRLTLLAVGGVPSDHYDLRGSQIVFGRESGDILFPRDPYLSRQHARLRMELRSGNMSVMLEDLDSANGTYLRMRGQAVLRPGDMFRAGDQILRVREV